jgi:hypothetical protein
MQSLEVDTEVKLSGTGDATLRGALQDLLPKYP